MVKAGFELFPLVPHAVQQPLTNNDSMFSDWVSSFCCQPGHSMFDTIYLYYNHF